MSLDEYVRKRRFDKTPEPAPSGAESSPTQGRYYVQRHDATRLHYDLRLEVDGTLKSWAVPKGPTLVPLQKNLAMHVEDHPIEYGEFEGNIPKGNYGGGSVMLWDRGTFELLGDAPAGAQLARGDFKFRVHGEKIKGDFALVLMKGRGKGNEWLLIKKRDEFADPEWDTEAHAVSVKTGRSQEEIAQDLPPKKKKSPVRKKQAATRKAKSSGALHPSNIPGSLEAPMPRNITPMTAVSANKPPVGSGWIFEVKWDGVRVLCSIEDGTVRLVSRNGNSFDRQYPELSVLPNYVAAETAIIDAEIAALDEHGRASFGLIQPRIHQTDPNSVSHLARKSPVTLFPFDLLYWDGYDLRGAPLVERKKALAAILKPHERIRLSEHFEAKGEEMLEAARQAGIEGIMAKRADSKYEARRSNSWIKVKLTNSDDFVICGYTHGERATFGSLVLGLYEAGKLVYVGNVGTGFNDRLLADLHARLESIKTPKSPFPVKVSIPQKTTWVQPLLVCECKFNEWTKDGRLRAPVFVGLRPDKNPEECIRQSSSLVQEDEPPVPEVPSEVKWLIPVGVKEVTTQIDGKSLRFSNVDKVYFPKDGYTKRDVLNYYDAVADLILPHLRDRPLSLKRYPNGIHEDFFFQKDIPETYPDWLRIEPIHSEHRGAPIRFVVADDRPTLLYLTNLGCIDQNPWMSRIDTLDYPDYILIDLDPQECPYDMIVEAARLVKSVLDNVGLQGYPKTTGGDGMHVFIPVEPRYTYEQARSFAEILSTIVTAQKPDLFTTPRSVSKRRKGRVYFDYLQISSGKTIAAPYVLRAYNGAPVATPLAWDEVEPGLTPGRFHIGNAVERFLKVGDLFQPVLRNRQKIEPALRRLGKLLTPGA